MSIAFIFIYWNAASYSNTGRAESVDYIFTVQKFEFKHKSVYFSILSYAEHIRGGYV